MNSHKRIIKVGDKVKVINPFIFLRCGYPLGLDDVFPEVDRHSNRIFRFLTDVDAPWYNSNANVIIDCGIRRLLAYGILVNRKFGGNNRDIHTEECQELKGEVGKVLKTKMIRTGIRSDGYWKSAEDYVQPYLDNLKNHIVLLIKINCINYWIEANNVVRYNKNDETFNQERQTIQETQPINGNEIVQCAVSEVPF